MQNSSVNYESRLLVVGTTPDYIHWIRENYPDRVVFITDSRVRQAAVEPIPPAKEEILVRLESDEAVFSALIKHLETYGITFTGVVCYDCESLELAATIASVFDFDFMSVEAVRNCRDKFIFEKQSSTEYLMLAEEFVAGPE